MADVHKADTLDLVPSNSTLHCKSCAANAKVTTELSMIDDVTNHYYYYKVVTNQI